MNNMKRFFYLLPLIAVVFASCDPKESEEYKALQFQNDSIQAVKDQLSREVEDYLTLIQDIDDGFETIRREQQYVSVTAGEGSYTDEVRSRISNDMYMINQIMADNKAKIEELEQKVKNGNIKSAKLQKIVDQLREQLVAKDQEIADLNGRIDSLRFENGLLGEKVDALTSAGQAKDETIEQQDMQIHKAYVLVATKKQLSENKIDVSKMKTSMRDEIFTAIDIRDVNSIPTNSTSAKVLTSHPQTSYELVRDDNKIYTLAIKNPAEFWSMSRYLIIQVR